MQQTLKELGNLLEDVEQRFQRLASEAGERAEESTERLRSGLRRLRERFADLERQAEREVRRKVKDTDRYVRGHPWETVGVAALVAFLLGAMLTRRRD
ncbi:MAG TPA: hypothetical protein VK437_18180 [Steroidobacteraceae bacterium]|nr:hypothetical protein [Steroidobacteraceae bacterium]